MNAGRIVGATAVPVDRTSGSPTVMLAGYGVGPETFRHIAGALPTGVTVVTTMDANGRPIGMTSGAVCGLSCEPPLLLTCIAKSSRTLGAIIRRQAFCVNVLAAHATAVSERFAGSAPDKFDGIAWRRSARGLPRLDDDSVAVAECELYETVSAGDHVIVMGLIVAGERCEDLARPLMYFRRAYAGWPA